jgi:hypothetical protein
MCLVSVGHGPCGDAEAVGHALIPLINNVAMKTGLREVKRRGTLPVRLDRWVALIRRPAVNSWLESVFVENPTFDALCGLVRRPAVTHWHHLIYIKQEDYAD